MTQKLSWPLLGKAERLLERNREKGKLRAVIKQLDFEARAVESPRIPEFEPWPEPYPSAEGFVEFEDRRRRNYEALRREYEAVFADCRSVGQAMRSAINEIKKQFVQSGGSVPIDSVQEDDSPLPDRSHWTSTATPQSRVQRWSELCAQAEVLILDGDRARLEDLAAEITECIKDPRGRQIAPRFVSWARPFIPWPDRGRQMQTMRKLDDIAERCRRQYWQAKREYESMGSLRDEGRLERLAALGRVLAALKPRESEAISDPDAALADQVAGDRPEGAAEPDVLQTPKRLAWTALPAGEQPFAAVVEHFTRIAQSRPEQAIDLERLKQIARLGPDQIWLGRDEFTGYAVFVFRAAGVSVLDCPVYGNAIYVIEREHWEELAQRTKAELLREHASEVRRIVHSGNWLARLEARVRPKAAANLGEV